MYGSVIATITVKLSPTTFGNADTGGAWLSSARAVRCWVKSRNERNPRVLWKAVFGDNQKAVPLPFPTRHRRITKADFRPCSTGGSCSQAPFCLCTRGPISVWPEFPLEEESYKDRIDSYQRKTGLTEAVQTGTGQLNGIPIAIGVMDFQFMGGSMGS
ncbi:uncharacterized protein LOC115956410 [Quercus lobata]|uniref:uncharacterized protein LOC115956410 n=1 Tax=Quercus lobata TaxID=97700 RepID=UPI001244DA62|nr:uncharacterized protein LOC115956410 [Quercus lobata]